MKSFKYYSFLFFALLAPFFLSGQITGVITDIHSGEPILNVNVAVHNSKIGTQTDANGAFKLKIEEFPVQIKITHVNFESQIIFVTSQDQRFSITLLPKTKVIDGIVISSQKIPELITDNVRYSIHDFLWWGNELMLLEFHGDFKKSYFSRWSKDGELIDRIKLKGLRNVHSIYKACNDQIYIMGDTKMYLMGFTNTSSFINGDFGIDIYHKYVEPCKVVLDDEIYYHTKIENDLLSIFKKYNVTTEKIDIIATIGDSDLLETYRHDKGYIAYGQGVSTMQVTSYQTNKTLRQIQQDSDFLSSVMYKPNFNHFMFYTNNTLVLLNHLQKDILYVDDDMDGEIIKIQYSNDNNWIQKIIQDEVTSDLYTFFESEKGIEINKINIEDGTSSWVGQVKTSIKNINTFQVHDNRLYWMDDLSYENSNDVVLKLSLDD